MALKAGRVGVNPASVDPIDGHVITEASEGYTKAEADEKFLAKTDAGTTYLSKTDAGTTYLSKTDAGTTYLSKSDAASTYQIKTLANVLGAKNYFNAAYKKGGTDPTVTNDGASIQIHNATPGTFVGTFWYMDVEPNTDYVITTDLAITSGIGRIKVETEGGTQIAITSGKDTSGAETLSFNSGNNSKLVVDMYVTWSTSAEGDITFNNFMVRLASDPDTTWEPYAMTNRAITKWILSQA